MKKIVENIVFNIRWILPLFYIGLVIVLLAYGYVYINELIHLVAHLPTDTEQMKILVLDMADVVMIANLVEMIITGSYNSFIAKDHGYSNKNISSGTLKIKIMTSIVIVASMSLLKSFVSNDASLMQLEIYGMFLLAVVVLGISEYIHVKNEEIEHKNKH